MLPEKELENLESVSGEDVPMEAKDVIATINSMKETMVSKEEYDKACRDRDTYFKAVVNGQSFNQETEVKFDRNEAIYKLAHSDELGLSNLETITLSLQLRDYDLENGLPDQYISKDASPAVIASTERAVQFYRDCIREANGNPAVFNALWQEGTKDNPLLKIKY